MDSRKLVFRETGIVLLGEVIELKLRGFEGQIDEDLPQVVKRLLRSGADVLQGFGAAQLRAVDAGLVAQLGVIAAPSGTELAAAQETWRELQRYMYEEYVPVVKFGTTQLGGVCSSDITGAFIKERLVWIDAHPANG